MWRRSKRAQLQRNLYLWPSPKAPNHSDRFYALRPAAARAELRIRALKL